MVATEQPHSPQKKEHSALEAAEQQIQLIHEEYKKLLRGKEVTWNSTCTFICNFHIEQSLDFTVFHLHVHVHVDVHVCTCNLLYTYMYMYTWRGHYDPPNSSLSFPSPKIS